jgi:subfamily B ATP-binding cassette protein MsbA
MRALRRRLRDLLVPAADGPQLVEQAPAVRLARIWRTFWPFTRPYRRRIALGVPLLLAVPAVETVEIYLFKVLVDSVLVPQELQPLLWLALAFAGLTLLGGLLSFADDYLAAWVGERFLLDLRARLFAHLHAVPLGTLERRRMGDVIARLTGDVQAIERFLLTALADGIGALARILFFGAAVFVLSWKLALAALVVVPLFALVSRSFSRLVKGAAREKRRRSGSLASVAEESLANAALVRSLDRGDAEVERFRRENASIMEAELAAIRIRGLFAPLIDLLELAGVLIVAGFGTYLLTTGELTLGGLLAFLAYLQQMYGPVRDLGSLANSVFAAAAGAERVIELLDEPIGVADRPGSRPLPAGAARGAVELRGVTYRHPGASGPALRDVSLTVLPGECVAVTGASGAGKSTLARLLVRLDDVDDGSVRIGGHDVRDVSLGSLRASVGLLLQESLLPDAAVRDVIAHGRAGATDAEIRAAARAAGADGFIEALPDGYETRVGQRGRRLSGGQRRRLEIARALLRDTPVLVLDEPTTGLDAGARDAVLEPLTRLMGGRTTIVISHDPAVVARADRVVRLEDGAVVDEAVPA